MSNKTLLIAGIIAAIVIILAVVVSSKDGGRETGTAEASKDFLPELKERMNDVGRIEITDGTAEIVVQRQEDQWVMASKGGYPVKIDTVRSVIRSLGDMQRAEEKTSNPGLYSRIDVEEPKEGGNAKMIRLYDDAGGEIAAVILGRTEQGTDPHQYVRKPGENTSWLVTGQANVNVNENSWLKTDVLDIGSSRPHLVRISHADGETVEAVREKPSETDFELVTIPEDREVKNEYATREFSRMLSGMRMNDVAKASELELGDPETEIAVTMFNGLRIDADVYTADGQDYVVFSASVDEEQIERENERLKEEAAATAPETEEGEAAPEPALIDPEEVQQEADEINATAEGWAYQFSSYIQDRITRRNEYFLKGLDVEPGETEDPLPGLTLPDGFELPETLMQGPE